MSDEQKASKEEPNIKESAPKPTPPKKKNPLIEGFTDKLGKAIDALAQEEKDIHAFSESGIDLKKIDTKAIKDIGKDLKGKLDKKEKKSDKPDDHSS